MPALSDYTSGTITLTIGSTAFTGSGTGWLAAGFREGDTILGIEDNAGVEYVIASITGNGAGTLTQEWEGATGTYAYRMRYMADGARVTAQARNLIELLGNGNLQAEAGIDGTGGNWLSYYTGAGTKARTALTAFARSLLDDANAAAFYATLGQIPNAQVGNNLPPDKAFRRGNILGTVSQTGGVPTGSVIERGSNANGEYVRFADGTQICIKAYEATVAIETSYSGVYIGTEIWDFPAAFAGISPVVTSEARTVSGGSVFWHSSANRSIVATPETEFFIVSPNNRTLPLRIRVMAIGRWF